jgi:hypothetical protein
LCKVGDHPRHDQISSPTFAGHEANHTSEENPCKVRRHSPPTTVRHKRGCASERPYTQFHLRIGPNLLPSWLQTSNSKPLLTHDNPSGIGGRKYIYDGAARGPWLAYRPHPTATCHPTSTLESLGRSRLVTPISATSSPTIRWLP